MRARISVALAFVLTFVISTPADAVQTMMEASHQGGSALSVGSDRAYCIYQGVVGEPKLTSTTSTAGITPTQVTFNVFTARNNCTGQASEVGVYSSAAAPTFGTNQTLTKIVAGATATTWGTATTTGEFTNSTPFATSIANGTYLWTCMHMTFATCTAPLAYGKATNYGELAEGLNTAGALTSGSSLVATYAALVAVTEFITTITF